MLVSTTVTRNAAFRRSWMDTYVSRSFGIPLLYSSGSKSSYRYLLNTPRGANGWSSKRSGPWYGLDTPFGSRSWSATTSSTFGPAYYFIVTRGNFIPTGGGDIGPLSNDDWIIFAFSRVRRVIGGGAFFGGIVPMVLLLLLLMLLLLLLMFSLLWS